jgi:hypothetical protein
MTESGYLLILFQSVHHVLRAEKLLAERGCPCKMIPIPRNVSSDCGVCLRVPSDRAESAGAILSAMQEPWRMEPLRVT